MTSTHSFKNALFIGLIAILAISCKPKEQTENFEGSWTEVTKVGNVYQIIDCGTPAENMKLTADSVHHQGIMEDFDFKANHVKQDNGAVTYYPDKEEASYYKFTWANQQKGIVKCEISESGTLVTKYLVNKANLGNIKKVKGSEADCGEQERLGDEATNSLKLGAGNNTLYVDGEDCIAIRTSGGNQVYERCFENCIVKLRHVDGNVLPLTLISGVASMDIDFYAEGDQWISKSVTYFPGRLGSQLKTTQPIQVSIKDFEFATIMEKFTDEDKVSTDTTQQ